MRNAEVMELPVTMRQGHDQLARVLVASNADHDAVDRALPLDLDPAALTTRDVMTVGAFGDDAFNRCQDRQPILSDLPIVSLYHQLQTRMQASHQVLKSVAA